MYLYNRIYELGPVAQLNRASDYGSEGYRFKSCRGHSKKEMCEHLFFCGSSGIPNDDILLMM